jgi:predicted acetyltransferase
VSGIELKELQPSEDWEIWEMIQEIGEGENGFVNSFNTENMEAFQAGIHTNYDYARGVNMPPNYVPQTIYWLYANGRPVGYGKLRHYLNESLMKHGGHIGYIVRPTERGQGFGTRILQELLKRAQEKGIERALLTCDDVNLRSRKVIETNGGRLENIESGSCRYWIDLPQK